MFDEFIREIRKLEKRQSVPIAMPLDDKGYFDRKCPGGECGCDFKVLFEDWRDKVPDAAAVCPKCGRRSEPTEFNTAWQKRYIAEVAKAHISGQFNAAMQRAARRTRPVKLGGGLLNVEMKVSYSARRPPAVIPPVADEALRQDLACEACGCRFSTLGAGYFCPACGHNSPVGDFDRTVAMAKNIVGRMDELVGAMAAIHDTDFAADFEQQLLEDQIENLVSAFQRCSEALFGRLPNAASFSPDANLFQRIADGSELWRKAAGDGYDAYLAPDELDRLKLMVQRRHKIGHCQGIVDDRYVKASGDAAYEPGQRLVTTRCHVVDLSAALEKLVAGLQSLV